MQSCTEIKKTSILVCYAIPEGQKKACFNVYLIKKCIFCYLHHIWHHERNMPECITRWIWFICHYWEHFYCRKWQQLKCGWRADFQFLIQDVWGNCQTVKVQPFYFSESPLLKPSLNICPFYSSAFTCWWLFSHFTAYFFFGLQICVLGFSPSILSYHLSSICLCVSRAYTIHCIVF